MSGNPLDMKAWMAKSPEQTSRESYARERAAWTPAEHAAERNRRAALEAEHRNNGHQHKGKAGPQVKAYQARCMAQIEAEPIDWLWYQRMALGKLNLIAGNPGGGKSQLLCLMAANVSTGRDWPDGTPCPRGSVIFISCEDDPSDTTKPRLMAAGADLDRIHILDFVEEPGTNGKTVRRMFDLGQDADLLNTMIRDIGDVGLVMIDPATAYLGKVDSHKAAEIRGALAPMQELAARSKAAFVLISHLSKGGADVNAMARVSGSFAWVALCRSAWLLEIDPKDPARKRRMFVPLKNNIGDDKTGFALNIEPVTLHDLIETSRVVFETGTVEVSPFDLLNGKEQGEEERTRLDDAKDFLREHLADGPRESELTQKAAKEQGITPATLRRARNGLRIKPRKGTATGKWFWALPDHVAQDSPSMNHEHLEQDEQDEQHEKTA